MEFIPFSRFYLRPPGVWARALVEKQTTRIDDLISGKV